LILQAGIGVDIRQDQVVLAYVTQSFRAVALAAHSVYALEPGWSPKEKMEAVRTFISDFRAENRITTRDLIIGIPHDQVIFREIEYPLSVRENLRSTLEYDIDKYIPLPAEDIRFDYQVIGEDRDKKRLKILLALIKKADCEPYISLCKHWPGGVYALSISTAAEVNCHAFASGNKAKNLEMYVRKLIGKDENGQKGGDGVSPADLGRLGIPSQDLVPASGLALQVVREVPIGINLLPLEIRKKPSRIGYYTLIGLAILVTLLAMAWAGGQLFQQQMRVRSVEREIKQLSIEVGAVKEMQQRIKALEAKTEILRGIRGPTSALDILRELTQVIPETAWVTDLSLSDKGIRLNGFAQSASELISLLESSPIFEDVVFLSAIVKDSKQNMERFNISLKPVNLNHSGKSSDTAQ